jgi:KipI family sensor histidine kinase inhibitor
MMTGSELVSNVRLQAVGDCALLIEFENRISRKINDRVLGLARQIESASVSGVCETVPSYRALLIHYDPLVTRFEILSDTIKSLIKRRDEPARTGKCWLVPVLYGGESAPDLSALAKRHSLTEEKVIELHSSAVYRVYMVGFAPGWTFLGGLDARLHTPRLATPRAEVPSGCISIGGQQTLIGGPAMPSGWNLIGRTPERSFAPERPEPFFMSAGDEVRIRCIDQSEFNQLAEKAASGARVSQEHIPS